MREDLASVAATAQQVAGVVAARGRGDPDGARTLMAALAGEQDVAAGAVLVTELALGMLQRQTGESVETCVQQLAVELEAALG